MKKCPVCGAPLKCRFTRSPKSEKEAVMVYCSEDARHARMFLNDPSWCRKARQVGDPMKLLAQAQP